MVWSGLVGAAVKRGHAICATHVALLCVALLSLFATDLRAADENVQLDDVATDSQVDPVEIFVLAEQELVMGSVKEALTKYERMVESAIGTKDDNAQRVETTSSIVGFALWRLFMLADPDDVSNGFAFRAADSLLAKGSPARVLFGESPRYVGTSLMEFEAELWSYLANVAWEAGDLARTIVYLNAAYARLSTWIFSYDDAVASRVRTIGTDDRRRVEELLDLYGFDAEMIEGFGDGARRALWRGKYLSNMTLFAEAVEPFRDALSSDDAGVKTDAAISLANALRRIGVGKGDIFAVLDGVLAQELGASSRQRVLIERSKVKDRAPGRDLGGAIRDLESAMERSVWHGSHTDDVLFRLALRHKEAGNIDRAQEFFARTRSYFVSPDYVPDVDRGGRRGEDERHHRAYFDAALLHYINGELTEAIGLLQGLVEITKEYNDPDPRFLYSASRFWWGRLLVESGDESDGIEVLDSLANGMPHDYYGVRARMHVNAGNGAKVRVFPDVNTALFYVGLYKTDGTDRANSRRPGTDEGPFGALRRALEDGTYRWAFDGVERLFASNLTWFNASDPLYLESTGVLLQLAAWRSLRRDALSSSALRRSLTERVRIAELMREAGDWETGSLLLVYWGVDPNPQSPGYFAALYPRAFEREIESARDRFGVPAELLYAVMLSESRFSNRAMSQTGARGLFQFQPETFRNYTRNVDMVEQSGKDYVGYLSDSNLSIDLGARWFRDLLRSNDGNLVLAVMEHNAGRRAILRWFGSASAAVDMCESDVELCVELARYSETRRFARRVILSASVSRAVGLFR